MKVKVGDRMYVPECKRPFKVRCRDARFIIATKPFNARKIVIYFIVDLKEKLRGPDNIIFCNGYETDEDCLKRLNELQSGKISVSLRRSVNLDLDIE